MDEVENFFFANFQILGPLGCQGWVVIPRNVKKTKITAPYCRGVGVELFRTTARKALLSLLILALLALQNS